MTRGRSEVPEGTAKDTPLRNRLGALPLVRASDTREHVRHSPSEAEGLPDVRGPLGTVILGEDIAIALNNSDDFIFGLRPDRGKRFIGGRNRY